MRGHTELLWIDSDALLFHLKEAKSELEDVIQQMEDYRQGRRLSEGPKPISNDDFAVKIIHAFHHLNSGWNSRAIKHVDDPVFQEPSAYKYYERFPDDIPELG